MMYFLNSLDDAKKNNKIFEKLIPVISFLPSPDTCVQMFYSVILYDIM